MPKKLFYLHTLLPSLIDWSQSCSTGPPKYSVIESLVALDTQTQRNHKFISNTFENG